MGSAHLAPVVRLLVTLRCHRALVRLALALLGRQSWRRRLSVILHGPLHLHEAVGACFLVPFLRRGISGSLRPACVLLPIKPLALASSFGRNQLKPAPGAGEELVLLLLRELLVVAARAAQVGSEGPPLVDDDDAWVGRAGYASAVLAVLLAFLLLVLNSVCLVGPAMCNRRNLDLFLATCLTLRLEHRPYGSPTVFAVKPLDGPHSLIQVGRDIPLIANFKLV